MPATTENYAIPYAIGSDNPRDFPAQISGPAAQVIDEQILKLNSLPAAVLKPTPTSPAVNYGAPFAPLTFIRDAQGIVHAVGFLRAVPENGTICTLPAGWRPSAQVNFERNEGRINVDLSGKVSITGAPAAGWVMMGGCVWLAEN